MYFAIRNTKTRKPVVAPNRNGTRWTDCILFPDAGYAKGALPGKITPTGSVHTYESVSEYANCPYEFVKAIVSNDSQLVNALVGEAVKLLSSMNAPAEIVGAFAVGYPSKVTELIARHKPEAEPVDLEKLVQETMARTLREAGLVRDRGDTPLEASRTINVEVNGRRTSVKVRNTLVQSLSDVAGDFKKAKKLIQDFAETAPDDTDNRSAWVEEQVNSYLLIAGRDVAGSVAH